MSGSKSHRNSIKTIFVKRLATACIPAAPVPIVSVSVFQLYEIRELANEQAVESVNRLNARVMNLEGDELAKFPEPGVGADHAQLHPDRSFAGHRIGQGSDIHNIKSDGFIPYIYIGLPMKNSSG